MADVTREGQMWDVFWLMECSLSGSWCAEHCLGVVVVSEHLGEVFVVCPPRVSWCFLVLSVSHLLFVSLLLCSSEPLVVANLGVRSRFLSIKAQFLNLGLSPDVLWVLLLLLQMFFGFFPSIS